MHFVDVASEYKDGIAIIMAGSGERIKFGELVERAYRLANYFRKNGLQRGDHIAVMMENNPRFFEIYWAAMISGLYYTPVNRYLSAQEAAYIVNDCQAKVFITSFAVRDTAKEMRSHITNTTHHLITDGACDGYQSYEEILGESSPQRPAEIILGCELLYSSGTSGQPKGIFRPLPEPGEKRTYGNMLESFGIGPGTVYLSPAPLYHAAPLGFAMNALRARATVVVMEKFDPVEALRSIEKYSVTHSQWVPTMFVRMLKLPESTRQRFDLSSHKMAIHGAGPCPQQVKRDMIEWWGPVLLEYFSSTEANGFTMITSQEWLNHPGSVGRAVVGIVHICDEDGNELPVGEEGLIYFEQKRMPFSYFNDNSKTRDAKHPIYENWTSIGDVGRVDKEGYIYLTDRKSELIISGGVNIYPAEVEHLLVTHKKVADVAVIGVPDDDFGESVKAIVQLMPNVLSEEGLEQELISFCKGSLASFKCPRTIDFVSELPRLPTGKLYKRLLREKYWHSRQESKLV